jgi:hypothetical protein
MRGSLRRPGASSVSAQTSASTRSGRPGRSRTSGPPARGRPPRAKPSPVRRARRWVRRADTCRGWRGPGVRAALARSVSGFRRRDRRPDWSRRRCSRRTGCDRGGWPLPPRPGGSPFPWWRRQAHRPGHPPQLRRLPQACEPARLVTGGSTAATMRDSAGAFSNQRLSMTPLRHSAWCH